MSTFHICLPAAWRFVLWKRTIYNIPSASCRSFLVVLLDHSRFKQSYRCGGKQSGRSLLLEEDIELSICTSLWLRDAEECEHETQQTRAAIEESCFCTPLLHVSINQRLSIGVYLHSKLPD